jgi:hypothetical protein
MFAMFSGFFCGDCMCAGGPNPRAPGPGVVLRLVDPPAGWDIALDLRDWI